MRHQTSTGRKNAAGSEVVVEADVVVDTWLVVAGSTMLVEVDALVDTLVAAIGQNATVVYPPQMIQPIHGSKHCSLKASFAIVRRAPGSLLCGSSSHSAAVRHDQFHGVHLTWFFKTPFGEDYKSLVGEWQKHRQDLANLARAGLKHVRELELTGPNRTKRPACFKVGNLVLVYHSRLPSWLRNCLQHCFLRPYCIILINGLRIHLT